MTRDELKELYEVKEAFWQARMFAAATNSSFEADLRFRETNRQYERAYLDYNRAAEEFLAQGGSNAQ